MEKGIMKKIHTTKRKCSNLLEEEVWDSPKRNNIDSLEAKSPKDSNINYDGDIESNDGLEQEKSAKRPKVIRKSSTQFDYCTQEKKRNHEKPTKNSHPSFLVQNANFYDYTSVYQSCRYHYNEFDNKGASTNVVSESGKSCATETVNNDNGNNEKTKSVSWESRQNISKKFSFESPIIAFQPLTLDQAIGFSSDAR